MGFGYSANVPEGQNVYTLMVVMMNKLREERNVLEIIGTFRF